jgi:hypothetical protein
MIKTLDGKNYTRIEIETTANEDQVEVYSDSVSGGVFATFDKNEFLNFIKDLIVEIEKIS